MTHQTKSPQTRLSQIVCGSLFIVHFSVSAVAGQAVDELAAAVSGDSFVRAFLGNCVHNSGNFERVVAAADALDYPDLPAELEPLLAPQDPEANFRGFFVNTGEGAPYFLGVSESVVDGDEVTACAIANPYIATGDVVSSLGSLAQVGDPDYDETSMGQRFRIWKTDNFTPSSFVSLMDAQPMGFEGATLSISSPSQ